MTTIRPRTDADLDELEPIAVEIQQRDGYPVSHSLDLRAFVASAGALVSPDSHGGTSPRRS